MSIASRLQQFMDSEGVAYDAVTHAQTMTSAGSAHAAHVPGMRVAKPVVLHHERGYALAVVPSTHRVELGSLQGLLGGHLGLATEEEAARLFDDCALGAIPPIGAAYGLAVFLDESLDDAPELYFEGGDHTTLVHVSGEAFRALTKDARRARFSHPG